MGDHICNVQLLLKNGQKSDSFAAYYEQQFNDTEYRTCLLRMCIKFKVQCISEIM